MKRAAFASFALSIALLAGCGDDSVPASPSACTPACRLGFTCVSGACVSACNPACRAGQTCTMTASGAACEGPMVTDAASDAADDVAVDGPASDSAVDDVIPDQPATSDGSSDAPVGDASVDSPSSDSPSIDSPASDVPSDAVAFDAPPLDVATPDAPSMDAVTTDTVATDTSPDLVAMDVVATDRGVDAVTSDVASDGPRPACGRTGEPCCQNRVCSGANVCDTVAMRCVAYTPTMGECTPTLTCPTGQVCGGIYLCGERPCLLCVLPGMLPLGAACMNADQCASDFCANGICTATCLAGSTGDAACAAMNPRMICGQFTSRQRATDAGVAPISTFGGCVTTCVRNADCASGLVCRLQRNDFEDRLDEVCSSPSGMLSPGAACDPNPPSTATAAMYCGNGQCLATGDHTGYCAPFCATDADCPSTTYACISFMFGRPSGLPQPIRMCARR